MKYVLNTMLAITVAVALAGATSEAAGAKHQKKGKAAAAAHSMTGCLQKGDEAGTFKLTNTEGKGPKTVEILSAPVGTDAHLGHKVTITGTAVSEKAAAKAEAKAEGKKKPSKGEMKEERGEHHMRVTDVKMVSATCP